MSIDEIVVFRWQNRIFDRRHFVFSISKRKKQRNSTSETEAMQIINRVLSLQVARSRDKNISHQDSSCLVRERFTEYLTKTDHLIIDSSLSSVTSLTD